MPYSVTRLQIQVRSRRAANQENSLLVSPVEQNDMINAAIADFYDLLLESSPPDYYSTDYSFSTVVGTSQYALPADFRSLQDVYVQDPTTTDRKRAVRQVMPGSLSRYRAPQSIDTVILRYTPTPVVIDTSPTGDAVTVDFVSGWDEYLVQLVTRDMLVKESGDISGCMQRIAEMRERIRLQAKNRSQGAPCFITEMEDMDSYGYPWIQRISGYYLRGGFLDVFCDSMGFWP